MSFFDFFRNSNTNSDSSNSDSSNSGSSDAANSIKLVQSISGTVVIPLDENQDRNFDSLLESYSEELGINSENRSKYSLSVNGHLLNPTTSLAQLIERGLLKAGDTVLANPGSDSKA